LPKTAKKQLSHAVIKTENKNRPTKLTKEEEGIIASGLHAGFEAAIQSSNSSNDVSQMSIEMGGRTIQVPTVEVKGILPPNTIASNKFYNPESKAAGGNGLDGILVTLSDAMAAKNRAELIKAITGAIPSMADSTTKEEEHSHYKNAVIKLAQAGTDINVKHYLLVRFVLEGEEKKGLDDTVAELTDKFGDDTFAIGEDA
jgi:hypothetical protein